MTLDAKQLLTASKVIAKKDSPALANRWQVSSAALARQAIEVGVGDWLAERDIHSETNHKVEFLCLKALHADPVLAGELHQAWCRLSEACHALSYDMPPTEQQLDRWHATVERFLAEVESEANA